jgi:hypothetical protein
MTAKTRRVNQRTKSGAAISEFTAALVMFFCFFFVPAVDMAFVPARYLLVHSYLEKVVHHMALSEKRSQAIQYLNAGPWRADLEKWGVTIKNAKLILLVNDNAGGKSIAVASGTDVPQNWLPDSVKKGQALVYSLELAVNADIPPLFSSDIGLPGFNRPITFTFRNRDQWENLSADPLMTSSPTNPNYYMNE